jgi:hypothetical protein
MDISITHHHAYHNSIMIISYSHSPQEALEEADALVQHGQVVDDPGDDDEPLCAG